MTYGVNSLAGAGKSRRSDETKLLAEKLSLAAATYRAWAQDDGAADGATSKTPYKDKLYLSENDCRAVYENFVKAEGPMDFSNWKFFLSQNHFINKDGKLDFVVITGSADGEMSLAQFLKAL